MSRKRLWGITVFVGACACLIGPPIGCTFDTFASVIHHTGMALFGHWFLNREQEAGEQ